MIDLDTLKVNADKKGEALYNTSYDLYHQDKLIYQSRGEACGVSFGSGSARFKADYIVYLLNRSKESFVGLEEGKTYLNWLLTKSPFADAFLEIKDADKAFEYGFVIVNCHIPANYMQAAMQATRMMWEYKKIPMNFHNFCQIFTDRDEAFYNYLFICSNFVYGKQIASNNSYSHNFMPPNPSKEWVSGFINKKFNKLNKNYSDGGGYRGVDQLFGEYKTDFLSCFVKTVKSICEKVEEKKTQNPFEASKKASYEYNPYLCSLDSYESLEPIYNKLKEEGHV